MKRILVVKLADVGDVLTATPALRGLRRTFPSSEITALVSPHCRDVLDGNRSVDRLLLFDKHLFETRGGLGTPRAAAAMATLALTLRRARFDSVVLLHHLTTPLGAAKYAGLCLAADAPVRAGLDNGRGGFLTHRAPDHGFGARHEVEYWNDVTGLLGAAPDCGPLEFPVSPGDSANAATLLDGIPGPLVAIHPGAGAFSLARRWPLDRFARVVAAITTKLNASVVLVGGREEAGLGAALAEAGQAGRIRDLTARTTLGQLGGVLARCSLFVGNDSGVMHLAAAVGARVLALFGPSNHRAWGPWTPNNPSIVIRSGIPCSPCLYRGHSVGTPEGCPIRPCLSMITPEQVVDTIEQLLAAGTQPAVIRDPDR
ncbi:MAG: glycosyltransferase family 9 protein [Dehalococcoidia bacterium]|nr:glycosyltransferase family 9 protein [Dehalococcoidia bacterium]